MDRCIINTALHERSYFMSKFFVVTNDGLVIWERIRVHHSFFGAFFGVRILTHFRVTMFWDGACRVDRGMDNPADFKVSLMICEKPLPMLKTTQFALT